MNSTINISFRYLELDYVRAMRLHYASKMRWKFDIVVIVLMAGAGVFLWRSASLHWFAVMIIVGAVVLFSMLIAAFVIIPPLIFRREPKFRDEYSLTFSPEGIHFRTTHIDSQLQWSLYSRLLVDAYSYVLYYGSHSFTVIPKRIFQSAEQKQSFERLLAQHVRQ